VDYLPQRDYCESCGALFTEKMLLSSPLILGTKGSEPRPFLSVIIPAACGLANCLEERSRNILQQDPDGGDGFEQIMALPIKAQRNYPNYEQPSWSDPFRDFFLVVAKQLWRTSRRLRGLPLRDR
jgi:hypothetical protein